MTRFAASSSRAAPGPGSRRRPPPRTGGPRPSAGRSPRAPARDGRSRACSRSRRPCPAPSAAAISVRAGSSPPISSTTTSTRRDGDEVGRRVGQQLGRDAPAARPGRGRARRRPTSSSGAPPSGAQPSGTARRAPGRPRDRPSRRRGRATRSGARLIGVDGAGPTSRGMVARTRTPRPPIRRGRASASRRCGSATLARHDDRRSPLPRPRRARATTPPPAHLQRHPAVGHRPPRQRPRRDPQLRRAPGPSTRRSTASSTTTR